MTLRFRLATALLFLALSVVFFNQTPTEARVRPWRGPHVTEDGWYYYHWLRSAAFDQDLDLANDYRRFGNWYGFGNTRTGKPHNPFGIGPAVLWAPGFALGHALARLEGGEPDGYSRAEQAGALATSFLAALGAFLVAFATCRRFVAEKLAWAAAALAFLGGPLLWYALYSPAMPHALEAFFAAAFFWALLPIRERSTREAWVLGLVTGGMLLVRPQLVVLVPLLFVGQRGSARNALLTAALAAAIFSPQLWVWNRVYGSWLVVPQGSGFMRFAESCWSETLFSSRNGLFTTTPLLWFVLPGLVLAFLRDRRLGAVLFVAFALQVLVNGAVWDWWGGGAFGGRRYAATFPVWALAFAFLAERLRSRLALGLTLPAVVGGLVLQWHVLRAHLGHAFSWEETVPFGERFASATGARWPLAGNPFAFPANAWFALRHGVPLERYDQAVGPYLLDERLPTTNPALPRKRRDVVAPSTRFLGRGFVASARGAELVADGGELLLPLNRPGGLSLELDTTRAELSLSFNGQPLARAPDGTFRVDAHAVVRGINVLGVESKAGVLVRSVTLIEGDDWPPAWAKVYER